jgi:hypothetical protein
MYRFQTMGEYRALLSLYNNSTAMDIQETDTRQPEQTAQAGDNRPSHTAIDGVVDGLGCLFSIFSTDPYTDDIRPLKKEKKNKKHRLENESFMQETRLMENQYSVNLPSRFFYRKKWNKGWINVVNPFRASIVLGTPGSGKSYAVVNSFIKQQIEKGFAMYIYDFKFPDLSVIAYNHLLNNRNGYKKEPTFYVINFDDPSRSHRCNPINPSFMTDISDAYESAYTIMLNLNRTWVQKQGDFFVESPIILFAAIIWYLRIYQDGKYCTFPHAIEFLNKRYEDIFPILTSYPDLENYLSPFMDAWLGGAMEQLQVRP